MIKCSWRQAFLKENIHEIGLNLLNITNQAGFAFYGSSKTWQCTAVVYMHAEMQHFSVKLSDKTCISLFLSNYLTQHGANWYCLALIMD